MKTKWYEIVFILIVVILLIIIGVTFKNNNLKKHCTKAICNSDKTICYNYEYNKDGSSNKTWQGNCSTLK